MRFVCGVLLFLSSVLVAARAAAEPVTVGISIPLTGGLAEYGVAIRNGIELAREEHPEGFENLKLIYDDNRYDPKVAVLGLNRMVDLEKVDLMYLWGVEPALGAAPVAERRKVPTFVVAQHPKACAGYRYVIGYISPAERYSVAMLEYLRSKGLKNFGILKSEISFFNVLMEEFQRHLAPDERLTVVQSFLPAESDFRSVIAKLKQQSFDAVGVYLFPAQLGQFFRQAAEQGYKPRAFGTTAFESGTVIKNSLGYMNGAVYSHVDFDPDFRDRYLKRYGDDIEIAYAANAYDFILLTGKLLGSHGRKLSAEEILALYAAVPPERGVSGLRQFKESADGGRYFDFPVVVRRIDGNTIVTE